MKGFPVIFFLKFIFKAMAVFSRIIGFHRLFKSLLMVWGFLHQFKETT